MRRSPARGGFAALACASGQCQPAPLRRSRDLRLLPPTIGRRQPDRLHLPEADRAAQLRLPSGPEQSLQRPAADAAIPVRRRRARGDHHVCAGIGRPAAGGEVRLRSRLVAVGNHRRTSPAGQVPLRQLPCPGAAEVATGICAGRIPAAARKARLSVCQSSLPRRRASSDLSSPTPAACCTPRSSACPPWATTAGRWCSTRPATNCLRTKSTCPDAGVSVSALAARGLGR